ncbi:MAG TPA: phosphonate ABC transporter, permease protein PhnE, partial [Bordetella sp.]
TIQIAIWGTFLAIVCAVPFALLCYSNIVPAWVYQPMRRLMDACRAINEMVFAMLFIAAVGLGPFAGVLALWVHTMGVLAKLFSESVEAIDPRPVEGVRATGANALEEIIYGVLPQVMPMWVSLSLYRFESNVRSASVLGIVGAGGIGMVLWEIIRSFQYAQTCAVMIIIIIAVVALDTLSARLRKALI